MRPVALYFGGKWALARRYGPPQRRHVIEPFAGFAGYSTYWEPEQVTLIEKDPQIVAVWKYLQRVSANEIMAIPTEIDSVDELHACEEAKWLVGWWFNRATKEPAKQRSRWARSDKYRNLFWGAQIRRRIANQVEKIRHWQVTEGTYEQAPDADAHWFIDPPYPITGRHYRCNHIDYAQVAQWCQTRRGYVQVCSNSESSWLPFRLFTLGNNHRTRRFACEGIYEFETDAQGRRLTFDATLRPAIDPARRSPHATARS
jgi:hypothetical protein